MGKEKPSGEKLETPLPHGHISRYAARRQKAYEPIAADNRKSWAIHHVPVSLDAFIQQCGIEARAAHFEHYHSHLHQRVINELTTAIHAPSTHALLEAPHTTAGVFAAHLNAVMLEQLQAKQTQALHPADYDFMTRVEFPGAPIKLQANVREGVKAFACNYFNAHWTEVHPELRKNLATHR